MRAAFFISLLLGVFTQYAIAQSPSPALLEITGDNVLEPGGETTLSLRLTHSQNITVGKFTLTLKSAGLQAPAGVISAIDAGEAALGATSKECQGCVPDTAGHLTTLPALTSPQAGIPITVGFLLPSNGEKGAETGGINGDAQEIARVHFQLPNTAHVGQEYRVEISDLDFSDAGNHSVIVTASPFKISVKAPSILLQEGANTTYHDPLIPGNFMVPTSGDDASTSATEPGFPNDGRSTGNRRYFFNVAALGLGNSALMWGVQAMQLDGSPAPDSLKGTVEPGNASGTVGIYTPSDSAMRMATALHLEITAQSALDPARKVTFTATVLPYGDANLDGRVTREDYDLAFRWANGVENMALPEGTAPYAFTGYVPSAIRRLLTDVRSVPGMPVPSSLIKQWKEEWLRLGLELPPMSDLGREAFPFGDGRISQADARWILKKAALNAGSPPQTLDPRRNGIQPSGF